MPQVNHKQVEQDIKGMTKAELKAVVHQLAAAAINNQEVEIPKDAYQGTSIGFLQS